MPVACQDKIRGICRLGGGFATIPASRCTEFSAGERGRRYGSSPVDRPWISYMLPRAETAGGEVSGMQGPADTRSQISILWTNSSWTTY
jgi:hypothetical protein